MSSIGGVNIPGLTSAELDNINRDGVITEDELISVGIDPSTLNLANPQEVRDALYDKYLQDNFGISSSDLDAIYSDDELTEEEIASYGLNVHGTQAQVQQELMEARLGKDLGLTPSDIEMVMSASHMTQPQLLEMLAGAEGAQMAASVTKATDTIASKGGADFEMVHITSVAPPPPSKDMSMKTFISTLIQSIAFVLDAKASINKADAMMNEARLNDILVISEQKMKHQTETMKKQVELLRKLIDHLNTMHAIMITVTVIALILVLIIAAVLAAAIIAGSGGTLTPFAIAGLVALTVLVLAAMTAATLTITEAELNRNGDSMYQNQQQREAVFWALMAIQIVATLGVGAAVVAAVAAAQAAAQTAVVVAQMTVSKAVMLILMAVSMMISTTMSLMNSTKVFSNAAEERQDDRKEAAEKKADKKKEEKIEELDAQKESGTISGSEYRAQRREVTKEIDGERRSDELSADKQYRDDMKELETVNYVLMAAALATGLGSAGAGMAAASASKSVAATAAEQMAQTIVSMLQLILSAVNASLSLTMAVKDLEFKNFQVQILAEMAEEKEKIALFTALEKLFITLKQGAEELFKNGMESTQNLVEALNSVISTNFSAVDKMTSKSVV